MQTLSSASRTCMASASAVECTATVAMPSSLAARRMRSAISPRLAMRILSNIRLLDHQKRLAVFDRRAVFDEDRRDGAGTRRDDLVEGLHGLDEEHLVAGFDFRAHLDEGLGLGGGLAESGADHRRQYGSRVRSGCLGRAGRV